jgi:hypothetical protein
VSGDAILWVGGVTLGAALFAWCARRFDLSELSVTRGTSEPDERRWTETVPGADGLGYGRSGGYHADLAQQDARGRRGDLDARA